MKPTYRTEPDGIWLDYGENKLVGPYPDRAAADKDATGLALTIPINVVDLWAWEERVQRAEAAFEKQQFRVGFLELHKLLKQLKEARTQCPTT